MMKDVWERLKILKELFEFLWQAKSWWIIPIVIVLIVFSLLIILTGSSAITPFIYVLF